MVGENENSSSTGSLTYAESQEPDEISQANALNVVDKFLSFKEEEDKENRYRGILQDNSNCMMTEPNSELSLSAKVVKYLSTRQEDKYLVHKMDVFDWVDTSWEEGQNSDTYNVGPATQMAAEVLEELFNAPPSKSEIYQNKIEETNSGNKKEETDKELCVFRHPKKKRTTLSTTLRQSVLDGLEGCVSDRLAFIMHTVKRKKRSPFVKKHVSEHGNLRACRRVGCEENNKVDRLRERNPRGSDNGMASSYGRRNGRHMHEIRADSTRSFSNERRNRSHAFTVRVIFSQNLDPKVVRKQKKVYFFLFWSPK
jgi:hypothetical protein